MLHWDGSVWSAAAWPDTPKWDLAAVWRSGADDVWAVGDPRCAVCNDQSSSLAGGGGIAHWDGLDWSTVSSQRMPSLSAVWGSASNNIWAVGGYASLHWNGSAWLRSDPPVSNLYAAWGSAANDIWAVAAYGMVVHWDGDAWSIALEPPEKTNSGCAGNGREGAGTIWGSSANDVWATTETTDLVHWNGEVWSTVPTGANDALMAVWGSASNDAWAVGCHGSIAHWDGNNWSPWPSPTKENLFAVSGAVPNDLWAAGYAGTVVHWDGVRWSVQELPAVSCTLGSGWNAQQADGSWSCESVGWESTEWWLVWSTAPNDVRLMGAWTSAGWGGGVMGPASSHWNGTEWSNSKEPVAGAGIWLNTSDDRWLAGTSMGGFYPDHHDIAHWNGVAWSELDAGFAGLNGIWGSSPREIWAVGVEGVILRRRQ